jgi:hypothetical protein
MSRKRYFPRNFPTGLALSGPICYHLSSTAKETDGNLMDIHFILEKIERMDQAQENYGYFDWLAKTGEEMDTRIHTVRDRTNTPETPLCYELDQSIGECLYLIDQRWTYGIDPGEFYYDENLIENFYFNHLATLPQSGLALLMALYFKLRELLTHQKEHGRNSEEHDISELNVWFLESCQLTAIAELLRDRKEELCLEIPPYTASIAPSV